MRATIFMLGSLCLLGVISAIADPASSATSPSPLAKKPGHYIKIDGRKMRVRKFRTTTTSTESPPIRTSTSTSITYNHDAPPTTTTTTTTQAPPTSRNEMLTESSSESTQWVQMTKSKRQNHFGQNDNVIDLGEQDLENLDLTKLYDRDATKDDPNAPTILQFIAPSSTSFMDPSYISKIISQQLGEGYQYTNYTITPSAITSAYSAPFPKEGFTLPPPPMNSYSTFAPTQEPITVRPTKHEFPQGSNQYQSVSNSNYELPAQGPTSGYSQSSSSSSPVAPNSNYGLSSNGPSPTPSTGHSSPSSSPVAPNSNYGTPAKEYAPSQGYVPLHEVPAPTPAYTGGKRRPGYVSLHPVQVYSSPSPTPSYVSYSPSPSPVPVYASSPSPSPPPVYNLPAPSPTYMYYSPPAPSSGNGYSAVSVGPSGVAGTFESSSTPTAPSYASSTPNYQGSGPSQGYSSVNEQGAKEYMAPPSKGSSASAWTDYANSKGAELAPVKISFPKEEAGYSTYKAPEYKAPEYKAPEYKAPKYNAPEYKAPGGYSTLSERLVAPGTAPAVLGGYGVPQGEPIGQEQPVHAHAHAHASSSPTTIDTTGKYSNSFVRGHTGSHYTKGQTQTVANDYSTISKEVERPPPKSYGAPATPQSKIPTVIRHHHHYVNYSPQDELPQQAVDHDAHVQSFGPSGYDDSYRAPKNIYEAMEHMNLYLPPSQPSAAPGIIYGTPAQAPQGRPNSVIRWPADTATTYDAPMPINGVPSYNPASTYGPPPAPSAPSAPTDTYGLPNYTPPAPMAPSSNYGVPDVGTGAEEEQERPQIHKTIYVNLPPEENHQKPKTIKHKVKLPPQRHYKIVFIKAPTPPPEDEHEVELPAAPESKTLIYVLTKKAEAPKPIKIVTPPPTKPSQPEVHFIQYKDEKSKDAQAPSGGYPDFTAPKGDYGLPNSAPDSNLDSYAAGSETSEQGVGYDISSSESKIEVKVSKSVKE